MFVRIKSTPNSPRRSIQIVENYRNGDKVKQKILRHVGIAMDESEEIKLKDLATEIIARMQIEAEQNAKQLSLLDVQEEDIVHSIKTKGRKKRKSLTSVLPTNKVKLSDIEEEQRIIEGVHDIAGHVYNSLNYDKILTNKKDAKRLKDLVLARLVQPSSKHFSQQILSKRFRQEHDLDALYRTMDELYDRIDLVKLNTFQKTHSLFPQGVELLLFDVTTLYFETTHVDELRKFGYSKDHRFQTSQVVLALATNKDGLPLSYELFAGNEAEVSTLIKSIESWQKLFKIERVCFIGDRAMFCKKNLEQLEAKNYEYIVAAKLKTLPKVYQTEILSEENYHVRMLGEQLAWIGEFEYEQKRLITSYKRKRAEQDLKEREVVLNKIKKVLGTKGSTKKLISNRGVKQFTKIEDSQTSIDENKVAEAALWDGIHGIITNIKDQTPEQLIANYARLWKIEESFRINKHTLKMRPIYHYKPERIASHIGICYMSYAVLRHMEYQVKLTKKISPSVIIDELLNVQASIYVHKKTGDYYRVPGAMSHTARKIYSAFKIHRSLDATIYLN